MSKPHLLFKEGYWLLFRSRHSSTYALPVVIGKTMKDLMKEAEDYCPYLLEVKERC